MFVRQKLTQLGTGTVTKLGTGTEDSASTYSTEDGLAHSILCSFAEAV